MNKKFSILVATALFISSLSFLISCGGDDDPKPEMKASSIELVSGGSQTAMVETTLENFIEVLVKDQEGNVFAGETLKFAVTEGSISAASVVTNANGKASITWTLGTSEGTQTLTVTGTSSLTGSPLNVTATATAAPLVATSIELVSGNDQTAMTEFMLENPIEIIVKDQKGNAYVGETVKFTVTEGLVLK